MIELAAIAVVLVPLLAAVVTTIAGPRFAPALAGLGAAATLTSALAVAVVVWRHGAVRVMVGGWPAPLGIPLVIDGTSATLLVTTAAIGAISTAYAGSYLRSAPTAPQPSPWLVWPLWLGVWAGIDAALISADLFNLYVAIEVVGLGSIALVAASGPAAHVPALRYVLVTMVGSLLYLLGVALIYADHGAVDLAVVGPRLADGPVGAATRAAMIVMIGGLLLKAAIVPLHAWLAPAHAGALAPVSALLSALVVATFFYVLLRVWLELFAGVESLTGGGVTELLGALGLAAIVWGSAAALAAARLKLLVAYSTVAQLGYLLLGFPLGQVGPVRPVRPDPALAGAWTGVVVFIVAHAPAKAAAFLAAGALDRALGSDRIDALRGAATIAPTACFAFGLAGVALIGLPPSGSFLGKWLLLDAAIAGGRWGYVATIVAGSLVAAAYVFRVLALVLRERERGAEPPRSVPAPLPLLAFALGLTSATLAFAAVPLLDAIAASARP